MRSSTRLRLIALCVNVERLWKDGFDHDHDHVVDHDAFDYGLVDHDAFDFDHLNHDAFDYGHAHAIELSASPVQGSHPYKGFVPNTLTDTFQGISGDTFQSVPTDTWQTDTFWSVQDSCQCIHYNTNMPLLPAMISYHRTSKNVRIF